MSRTVLTSQTYLRFWEKSMSGFSAGWMRSRLRLRFGGRLGRKKLSDGRLAGVVGEGSSEIHQNIRLVADGKTVMDIKKLLAPRIEKHCLSLYESGEHKHAAREALVQVELALKEKGRLGSEFYGIHLIKRIFKGHQGVVLKVPLGDDLQEKAQKYFEAVFSY